MSDKGDMSPVASPVLSIGWPACEPSDKRSTYSGSLPIHTNEPDSNHKRMTLLVVAVASANVIKVLPIVARSPSFRVNCEPLLVAHFFGAKLGG